MRLERQGGESATSIMPAAYASMKKLVGGAPFSGKSLKATNSGRLSCRRNRASWIGGLGATNWPARLSPS